MQTITVYSPARIILLGLVRTVFGLLILGMGVLVLWAGQGGEFKPTKPGDMPAWWMMLVGAALALGGLNLAAGGVGRILGGFARNCYFRAGPQGLAIRLPKNGWFGWFRIVEYRLEWPEIKQFVHFKHSVNLIPVSSELRIELTSGKTVVIERRFFADSVRSIQEKLISLQTVMSR